jgi:hypothetical protein
MARGKKMTTYDFILKSIEKHSNKFDYSKVSYINMKNKVIIICKEHGEFLQNPNNHLNGQGCFNCASDNKRSNKIDFINKSIKIHNDKFDYSLVEYKSVTNKVKIICKEHGEFEQIPNYHLSGSGCPRCCKSSKIDNLEFIKRARIKHGDKYDYSITNYTSSLNKVDIICKEHGVFSQIASNHLYDNGCPNCSLSYGEKENKWLDLLGIKERQVKIDKYIVDGYDHITNTIYEFNGDFWHGNPSKYKEDDINPISGKSFGYLLKKTIEKEDRLKELGYNLVSIWESEYIF